MSGAGRSAQLRTSYVELEGAASIYRAGTEHAHVPEIERALDRAGALVSVGFVPQLAPMSRGILLTANAPLSRPVRADDVHAFYARRYAREPFVRVLDAGVWPETRAVARSNRCDVAVTVLHGGRTLLAGGRARQPGEGRRRAGDPESQPHARSARVRRADDEREPVVTRRPVVVKVGGRACETFDAQRRLADEIAGLADRWCSFTAVAPS